MALKEGSLAKIDYTGRVVGGDVFDTTREKDADKQAESRNGKYEPVLVVAGKGELVQGLDKALIGMKKGDNKKLELEASEAFGERSAELVKVIPLKEFKKEKMTPFPGMIIEANGRNARVQSVSGGRVRVDFNHPLAGRSVEFDVEIKEEITDKEKGTKAVFEKYFGGLPKGEAELKVKGEEAVVRIDAKYGQAIAQLKKIFSDSLTGSNLGIKKVVFVEEFEGKKKEKSKGKEKTGEKSSAKKEETADKTEKKETEGTTKDKKEEK